MSRGTTSDVSDGDLDDLLAALASAPAGRQPGDMVSERVSLIRRLDTGGMGEVWIGQHETLGVEVAVKFIRYANTGGALKRFTREARLAARLKSPHSVRVFDHGVTIGGSPFIVMELLNGETLADRLARRGPLSLDEAGQLLEQLAAALEEAHGHGVIHRDVKPSNVFLSDVDTSSRSQLFGRLLDFGLARGIENGDDSTVTASGALPGTPRYMAPEQLMEGVDAGYASDRWALGVVMYEALSGRPPFAGKTSAAIASSMRDPIALDPIPAALHGWFRRALARKPAERFDGAAAMASAFAEATPQHRRPQQGGAWWAVAAIALGATAVAWASRSEAPRAATAGEPSTSAATTAPVGEPTTADPPDEPTSAATHEPPPRAQTAARPVPGRLHPAPQLAPTASASAAHHPPPAPSASTPKTDDQRGLIDDVPF